MEIKKVIKNGQTYTLPSGGGGSTNIIRLTQAEYDALVETQTIDENAIYVIEDAENNYYNKEEVDTLIENATPANYSTISGYAENAVAGFNTNNLTNYNQLTYRKSTGSTYYSIVNFPKLKINGTNNNILGNSNLIDLDTYTDGKVATKQDKLVSGTNIKTINNQSILGNGNITIEGGGGNVNFVNLTQAEYDALTEKDPNVIYNITDATDIDVYTKEEVDELIEEIQLYKFPNVTIFGQPTIQNGQVSNFSNSNYLQFPFLVDFQKRPFNIYFSFTTPSNLSGQENILDSNYGLAFAIRDGKVVCVVSVNGTSWTTGELISDQTLTPNTTYYFRIKWTGGEMPFLVIDGGLTKDYGLISLSTVTDAPYPKTMVIGRSFVDGGNYYKGSINLNDASLEISNKVVWQGMDDVGLATRLAVDMSNLDDKGKEVIDDRIDAKIGNINSILENIIGG